LFGDKDRAVSIANEAIKKEFGETEENLKAMMLCTELRSYVDQQEHCTWHVYSIVLPMLA
jgi:hypothetical protein